MENAISLNVSPIQALLALAFQVWIIVFPIIIIRKLNYMTDLLSDYLDAESESA